MNDTSTQVVFGAHSDMCKTVHNLDDDGGERCYRLPAAEALAGHEFT
jgi:hypothetical protein